jgi:hypothetical protein
MIRLEDLLVPGDSNVAIEKYLKGQPMKHISVFVLGTTLLCSGQYSVSARAVDMSKRAEELKNLK